MIHLLNNNSTIRPHLKPCQPKPTFGASPKHLAIFTTNVGGRPDPYTRQLIQEAQNSGWTITEIHPQDVVLEANENEVAMWIKDKRYTKLPFDYVLPRLGARYITEAALTTLECMERMGVDVINDPDAIRTTENKILTHLVFAQQNLPQPKTYFRPPAASTGVLPNGYKEPNFSISQIAQLGRSIVIKPNAFTSGGKNKRYVHAINPWNVNNKMTSADIAQHYYSNVSQDFRYIVCDGKVIAASERRGDVYSIPINSEVADLASSAMKSTGLTFGTVDILKTSDGYKLIEINPSPGLQGPEFEVVLDHLEEYIEHHPPGSQINFSA